MPFSTVFFPRVNRAGAPSLRDIANILQTQAPESVERLLVAVAFNVLIGNGDAHAKNFSLLHRLDGRLELTPLYDLMSTIPYGSNRLAMYIDDVRQIARASGDRIVNEATRWGLVRGRVVELVEDLLDRILDASVRTRREIIGTPESIPRLIEAQVDLVRRGLRE